MGLKEIMSRGSSATPANLKEKLYTEERAFRADRLIEKWSNVPEVGVGLDKLDETSARNTAIHLENQARYMTSMKESQTSAAFQGFTPENMLRLVRLVYPNTIRGKLFTELK